jgi:hypothetical protein
MAAMSNALALGAVSAVLRNVLDNGLIDVGPAVGSPVKVTAVAPDSIPLDDPHAAPQLNLFLYRVTPNPGWRNAGLPSRDSGGYRLTNPPLALDLHYLVTAYGRKDLEAEVLLGYAMHLLHERPFLDRDAIRKVMSALPLDPAILPDAFRDPPGAGLADQVETLKITWESMDTEELSRLWSAMQAHYRPSAGYQVSVVLIEADEPAVEPLPVLTRGGVDVSQPVHRDRGVRLEPSLVPPLPTVDSVELPSGKDAAELGDPLILHGHHLDGTNVRVFLGHRLLATPHERPATVLDAQRIKVDLPGVAETAQWPAGVWSAHVALTPSGEPQERSTNTVAVLIRPTVTLPPVSLVRSGSGTVTAEIGVVPRVWPEQSATLALDGAVATAPNRTAATDTLTFVFDQTPSMATGPAWVRLRVDGVESWLIDQSKTPPEFIGSQQVIVP